MNKFSTLLTLLLLSSVVFGQEEIKILHQNILYYGKTTKFCDENDNTKDAKNEGLRELFSYVHPDIFTCNEMDDSQEDIDYLLDNALNMDGRTSFVAAPKLGDYLLNQLYYDSKKLILDSSQSFEISYYSRDAYFYKLHTKDTPLVDGKPSAYIHIILLHLKAGSDESNKNTRVSEMTFVIDKLAELGWKENIFIIGDLNLYGASEGAYQLMVNPQQDGVVFADPISQEGEWHDNPSYSLQHTQSTHKYQVGCESSGGTDDRFDFIMSDLGTKLGQGYWRFKSGSYDVVGQDGTHFNKGIEGASSSVYPNSLLNAIYNTSDHYPVTLTIGTKATSSHPVLDDDTKIVENPFVDKVRIAGLPQGKCIFEVYSVQGAQFENGCASVYGDELRVKVSQPSGIYIVKVIDAKGKEHQYKVVKK
ncbi:T9SS type A sorting domain-containing protein [Halosquirtibacter laminarini]|uniref:T9SS type A sorting domain-containing protein n=1 Tax=Halosquirtibacter laminarini TaxID=3374600 RepID=A0AC61NDZ0_9BACT|nr:T9SS type A sorting domain-containing protein [Prolixibacteraceae bacterium]